MSGRRDAALVRLRKKFDEWNSYPFRRRRKAALDRDGKRDLSDETVWAETAREAFVFRGTDQEDESGVSESREEDGVLMDAFWTFNLDPADPRDCRALLDIFAEVLAPELSALATEYARVGARKKWNSVRLLELVAAVDKIKQDAGRKLSDAEACKRLKALPNNPSHIEAASSGALVRHLVEGRSLIRKRRRVDDTPVPLGVWRKITSG